MQEHFYSNVQKGDTNWIIFPFSCCSPRVRVHDLAQNLPIAVKLGTNNNDKMRFLHNGQPA